MLNGIIASEPGVYQRGNQRVTAQAKPKRVIQLIKQNVIIPLAVLMGPTHHGTPRLKVT